MLDLTPPPAPFRIWYSLHQLLSPATLIYLRLDSVVSKAILLNLNHFIAILSYKLGIHVVCCLSNLLDLLLPKQTYLHLQRYLRNESLNLIGAHVLGPRFVLLGRNHSTGGMSYMG